MPNTYKNVIGTFPVRGVSWGSYTKAQIEENLLYFIGLITNVTGLEIKTDLTIDDRDDCETHGNIYFLGYPDDNNAIFCVYRTRYNEGTFELVLEFVNRYNVPMWQPNSFSCSTRWPDRYASIINFETNNANNIFGFSIFVGDHVFYFSSFAQDNSANLTTVLNTLNTYRITRNGEKLGCYLGSNKKYKFKQMSNQAQICFMDPDINIGSYVEIATDRAAFQYAVDMSKNYIQPIIKMYNSNAQTQENLPSDFIYVYLYNHIKSNDFGNGNIMKIDDKYYLCIQSYGNNANMCICLGTSPVIFE